MRFVDANMTRETLDKKSSKNLILLPEVVSRSTPATARTNIQAVQTSPWNTVLCARVTRMVTELKWTVLS